MKRIFITMVISIVFLTSAIAQKTVSGKVVDSGGKSLPGVNIIVKGTSKVAVTDLEGNYKIDVNNDNAVLVFKFIGMKTIEVPVNGQTNMPEVVMEDDATGLDEIVVVGYGTSSKRALIHQLQVLTTNKLMHCL